MSVTCGPDERLRPTVQLAEPVPNLELGNPVARFHLAVLTDADPDEPRRTAYAEPFALPIALHHRGIRSEDMREA